MSEEEQLYNLGYETGLAENYIINKKRYLSYHMLDNIDDSLDQLDLHGAATREVIGELRNLLGYDVEDIESKQSPAPSPSRQLSEESWKKIAGGYVELKNRIAKLL